MLLLMASTVIAKIDVFFLACEQASRRAQATFFPFVVPLKRARKVDEILERTGLERGVYFGAPFFVATIRLAYMECSLRFVVSRSESGLQT